VAGAALLLARERDEDESSGAALGACANATTGKRTPANREKNLELILN
jgi:hypothetical protein